MKFYIFVTSIKYLYDNTIMKVFSIFLLEGFNAVPTKTGIWFGICTRTDGKANYSTLSF